MIGTVDLLVTAAGLSADAFAVSVCKGMAAGKPGWRDYLKVGLYFGGFQALMPLAGYLLSSRFEAAVMSVGHWIAFAMLSVIGGNMVWEAVSDGGENPHNGRFDVGTMLPLAVATSVDAFAVGVTFAFLGAEIRPAAPVISTAAFGLSVCGLGIGSLFGRRCHSGAGIAGGVILLLLGVKILAEHFICGG